MHVGIDTGGTNVDAVAVDSTRGERRVSARAKVPGNEPKPTRTALDRILDGEPVDRVVVATTLVLNAAVQQRLPACTNVLVPGPGLHPERAFHGEENHVEAGCVDHRGRVTEETAYEETPESAVVAITAKFGTRNPKPEREVREDIDREAETIALGHAAGPGMTFPRRAATTVANAKAGPTFAAFATDVAQALSAAGVEAPVYYLKGDGAMLSADAMRSTPAHALRAGPAASALGLLALSGVEDAVCVDIGGTTTDVTRLSDGLPATEPVEAGALETGYDGVRAVDLPLGGDTRVVADGLTGEREGKAAAFGGDVPALTDALHVTGRFTAADAQEACDPEAARDAFERFDDPENVASAAIDSYVSRVADAIESVALEADRLVAGGVLAPHLAGPITGAADVDDVVVPDHADVAGAVGCAAARVSVETGIHVDSARGTMTVSALGTETETVESGRTFTDDEVESLAAERARAAARQAGASSAEDLPVEVRNTRRFNVVERSRVAGQIIDATAQVEPGLAIDFGDDR
jgi:N-methylhydantoinase A/oxoprolinase/acetone carboxylase beta subunit